jgi:hypothetical protein
MDNKNLYIIVTLTSHSPYLYNTIGHNLKVFTSKTKPPMHLVPTKLGNLSTHACPVVVRK